VVIISKVIQLGLWSQMTKRYSTISIKIKRSKDIALIGLKKSKEWKVIPIYLLKSKGQKKQLISKDFSSINWQSMCDRHTWKKNAWGLFLVKIFGRKQRSERATKWKYNSVRDPNNSIIKRSVLSSKSIFLSSVVVSKKTSILKTRI